MKLRRALKRGLAIGIALGQCLWTWPLQALPQNGVIKEGTGAIVQTSSTRIDVTQTSSRLIIDWSSFNLGIGEQIFFNQALVNAAVLNRVLGGGASSINGQISASGQFSLVNAGGINFGANARVDVASLIATTSNIKNTDFMAGRLAFTEASPLRDAIVVNQGIIRVADGGYAALSAAAVRNEGIVEARYGTVVLAGAKAFTIDLDGDRLLSYQVTIPVDQAPAGVVALIENTGSVKADGGRVLMTARAAKNVLDNVINTNGLVQATTASLVNGEIIIDGGDNGIVAVSGRVDATGLAQGEKGGTVKVLGEKVGLMANAVVDASGEAGGGIVLVGGNYLGKGPEQNAKATYVDATAVIHADATMLGNGGKVIVWSDEYTGFFGKITARGGAEGGNGGFVETSSKNNLQAFGRVNASAPAGLGGTWLLDPFNVTITGATANGTYAAGVFTPTATGSTIDASAIQSDLNAGTSVTIQTSGGGGAEAGNITVASAITKTVGGAATLTLQADGTITVNAAITDTAGNLSLALLSNGDITQTAALIIGSTSNINAGIGQITLTNTANNFSGAVTLTSTSTGAASLTHGGAGGLTLTASSLAGSLTVQTDTLNTPSGTVTLSGVLEILPTTTARNLRYGSGGGVFLQLDNARLAQFTGYTGVVFGSAAGTGSLDVTGVVPTLAAGSNLSLLMGGAGGAMTVSSALTLTGSGNLAVLAGSGGITLTTNLTTANGNLDLAGPVTIGGGTRTLTTTGGNITITGTIDGADILNTTAGAGNVTFGAVIGGTTPLTSLNTTGTTGIVTLTGNVTTVGQQTYDSAVTLAANSTLTTTDTAINFSGTVDGGFALATLTGDGFVNFGAAVGGTTPLASVNLTTSAIGAITLSGNVTTTGTQTYGGPVSLFTAATLTTTNAAISFSDAINGAFALVTNSGSAATSFNAIVGGTTPLASLATTGTSGFIFVSADITTAGIQTYTGPVSLLGAATLTTTNSNITFNGAINGGFALITDSGAGNTTFAAVGPSTALASLFAQTTSGTITLNGNVTTTGIQDYSGPLSIAGAVTLTTTGAGSGDITFDAVTLAANLNVVTNDSDININSTINGGFALTANAGAANVNVSGVIGGTTPLAAFTSVGSGITFVNADITTAGAQVYAGDVTTTGARTLTTTSPGAGTVDFGGVVDLAAGALTVVTTNSNVTFLGTIDGGSALDVNTGSGVIVLATAIGAGTPLASLTVFGQVTLGGNVTTTGAQSYGGSLGLTANVALATSNSAIAFDVVDGAFSLTTSSGGGNTLFGAAVGNVTPLTSLSATTTSGVIFLTDNVTTTGAQNYNGDTTTLSAATVTTTTASTGTVNFGSLVSLGANLGVVTNNSQITFASTVEGGFALAANAGAGNLAFAAAVGGVTPLASVVTTGTTGTISIGGNITTTGIQTYTGPLTVAAAAILTTTTSGAGAVTIGDDVTLGANLQVTTANSAITFSGTVDGTFNLVTQSGTANTTFSGAIGAGTPVSAWQTTATTGNVNLNGGTYIANSASLAKLVLGANTTIETTVSNLTINGTINGAFTLALDGNGSPVTLISAIGGTTPLTSLAVTGSLINVAANITTTGAQTYNSPVTLLGAATLTTTSGGNINFVSTIDGGSALVVSSGAGGVTFGDNIGSGTALASLATTGTTGTIALPANVITTGNQTYTGPVSLVTNTSLDTSSGTGAISFNSTVTGGFNLTTDSGTSNTTFSGTVSGLNALNVTANTILLGNVTTGGAQDYFGTTSLSGNLVTATTINIAGPLVLTGTSSVTAGVSSTINLGSTVATGAFNFTVTADLLTLGGNWTGTSNWLLRPFTPVQPIGLGGAVAGLDLDATEIGFLNNGTPSALEIGIPGSTATITGSAFTFNSPLVLAGGNMTLATITKTTGGLDLDSTGTLIADLNLSTGTGILTLSADNATITGTINGIAGPGAALQALMIPPLGLGPFLANGADIPIFSAPPPPIVTASLAETISQAANQNQNSNGFLGGGSNFNAGISDQTLSGGPGGPGGNGGGGNQSGDGTQQGEGTGTTTAGGGTQGGGEQSSGTTTTGGGQSRTLMPGILTFNLPGSPSVSPPGGVPGIRQAFPLMPAPF